MFSYISIVHPRRWFSIASASLLLVMLLTLFGGVQGAKADTPPSSLDGAAARQLYQRLLDAGDNAKEVWQGLSVAEQQAIMTYTKTSRVDRGLVQESRSPHSPGANTASGNQCLYDIGFWTAGYNGFGMMTYRYTLRMSWCGDGSWITYAGSPYTTGETFIAGWGYQGNVSGPTTVVGGAGYNQWEAAAQGKFTLTIQPFGVVQEEYPHVSPVVWPDMTWSNWP